MVKRTKEDKGTSGAVREQAAASAIIPEATEVNAQKPDNTQEPESACADSNCPVHGRLRIHGRQFTGVVTSARMRRTANIVIEKTQFMRKYERYERRLSNIKVHNPECISAREGDKVEVFECRPLSKTKHFVITKKL